MLLDNFGRVQAAEPERPEILGADWSDRAFFRELLATPSAFFSDATQDGPDGSRVVVISVPVRSPIREGRTRDAEGHDIVAAYAPVPGTRWTLVSEDDWAALIWCEERITLEACRV